MTSWQKQRAFASDLTTHGDYRGDCPFCGGKNTYTATIGGGSLKWNCYKMDCHVSGIHDTDMTAEEIMNLMSKTVKQTRQQEAETMEIPVYVVKPTSFHDKFHRFTKRYGLAVGGLLYDVKDERAVFLIRDKHRKLIDAIGRSLNGAMPEWYRYTGNADVYTRCMGQPNGVVVIVEDIISAITIAKMRPNVTGMAVLGTNINHTHMAYLEDYSKIIVALDPDATNKSIEYRKEIQSWTGIRTMAMMLQDDIKYKTEEDLIKLKEYTQ